MDALVFATCDVTPEHWAEFAQANRVPDRPPDEPPIVPYILVPSRSPTDLENRTEHIDQTVKTDLASATWSEIKGLFIELASPNLKNVNKAFFLVLDNQSLEDHKAVVMEIGSEWRRADGEEYWPLPNDDMTGVQKFTVWTRHRVPYQKVWDVTTAIMGLAPEIDTYVEEVKKEVAPETS
ncbi:hypothetical protein BDV96DRAFT_560922 [Lophiotrema nucula]|uniref:Uncharacterized protein n=1 Tax=Lophiotrema nucula TaxID=690887 RepID=A0A6A5ZS16_9PLEO|nr:hypothetical protein BDV96DRAFT_560922 [Lophiotrema nucula]